MKVTCQGGGPSARSRPLRHLLLLVVMCVVHRASEEGPVTGPMVDVGPLARHLRLLQLHAMTMQTVWLSTLTKMMATHHVGRHQLHLILTMKVICQGGGPSARRSVKRPGAQSFRASTS